MQGALIRVSDGNIYRRFQMGKRVSVPGGITVSPSYPGWTSPNGAWRIVEIERVDNRPGEFYDHGEELRDLTDTKLTITQQYVPWPQPEIDAEIARREEKRVDELVAEKVGRVLYALAKDTRPTLTPQQFRSWVKSL